MFLKNGLLPGKTKLSTQRDNVLDYLNANFNTKYHVHTQWEKKKLAKGSKYINNYKKHQNFIIFTLIA